MARDKAFVVIPAFNEQTQIASVILAAQKADPNYIATDHVIVVNNNSSDHTAKVAHNVGAEVLDCEVQGKGWAMLAGATHALTLGASALTFLDADLVGLTADHVNRLTRPVLEERSVMSIGYLGGRPWLSKQLLSHWGAFSGQRTVSLDVWDQLNEKDFIGWRIEGALNAVCRNMGLGDRIMRRELEGLRHLGKRDKEPNLLRAGWRYAQTYSSAVRGLMSRSGTSVEYVTDLV